MLTSRGPSRRIASGTVGVSLAVAVLAGCSSTVALDPAADANDPLCADVIVRLPDALDGQDRRWTDAQSTGAWGDPAAVLLTCGVTPPGPTEAQCITIGGVDWIVDDSQAPTYLITSYGRTPAVEVFVDNETVSPNEVLGSLGPLVEQLPAESSCTTTDTLLP
ncbi:MULTISPECIES: DUF3515 family protein [unclassified Microbacterium]|uniref:DUF3515 family protein n=1 Tax=unclassified Microbacterium TaxID=2609290 RepID=UPI00257C0B1E|nr:MULTISPECIES: DUF3515 family protein [unclassified Microbacterium]